MNTQTENSNRVRLYDWNGTIFDDTPGAVVGANAVLRHVGRNEISAEQFRECFEIPIENYYCNLGFSPDDAKEYSKYQPLFHQTYMAIESQSPLRDGAEEALEDDEAQGIQSIILSNHIESQIRGQLRRLGIEKYFAAVLANPDAGSQFREPKSVRLKHYFEANKTDPKNAIIVGDTPEETQIARQFGMFSVAITGGYASQKRLEAVEPDYIIHSLRELKPVLRELRFA